MLGKQQLLRAPGRFHPPAAPSTRRTSDWQSHKATRRPAASGSSGHFDERTAHEEAEEARRGGDDGSDMTAAPRRRAATTTSSIGASPSESHGSSCGDVRGWAPPHALAALAVVNAATKWAVSGAVLCVLCAHARDARAAYAVVGAILSSFLCKALKHALNHERPAGAQKADPGMPSSHANSLNFLSVYGALALVSGDCGSGGAAFEPALAAATVAAGVFLTWLRVALGLHTWPQVVAGAALGASTAAAWFALAPSALAALRSWGPPGVALLYVMTGAAMAAFAAKNLASALDEWRGQEQQQQQQRRRRAAAG